MNCNKVNDMVSVVITCFNYAKYLSKSIESALNQTYKKIEIIVVNDGSTDNTDEVIGEYLSDPRITYIKQENKGQANAKNVGINHSKGGYVAFLDADDIWCAAKIEKQMVCFANKITGVVYCRARYVDENDVVFDYEMTGTYLQPQRGNVTKWLLYDNFVQFSSSVVRKECFERFGTFDESLKMGIDWDLWLRISTFYDLDFVDDRLFYYRMGHSGQMSKNILERQKCSDRIMENFLKNFPNSVCRGDIRKSFAYTYCNRGNYMRSINKKKSYAMFLMSIVKNPFWVPAYKGIIKNILY
jgi:glycosyltransferase involved in cell wall biosynthesis